MDTTEMIDPVTGEIIDAQLLAEQLLRQDLLGLNSPPRPEPGGVD